MDETPSPRKKYQRPGPRPRTDGAARKFTLKAIFGLTPEDYDEMAKSQGGLCAGCKKKCAIGRRLCVDHCHKTGEIRGLLCGKCNMACGMLDDDPDLMESLAHYFRTSRTGRFVPEQPPWSHTKKRAKP